MRPSHPQELHVHAALTNRDDGWCRFKDVCLNHLVQITDISIYATCSTSCPVCSMQHVCVPALGALSGPFRSARPTRSIGQPVSTNHLTLLNPRGAATFWVYFGFRATRCPRTSPGLVSMSRIVIQQNLGVALIKLSSYKTEFDRIRMAVSSLPTATATNDPTRVVTFNGNNKHIRELRDFDPQRFSIGTTLKILAPPGRCSSRLITVLNTVLMSALRGSLLNRSDRRPPESTPMSSIIVPLASMVLLQMTCTSDLHQCYLRRTTHITGLKIRQSLSELGG